MTANELLAVQMEHRKNIALAKRAIEKSRKLIEGAQELIKELRKKKSRSTKTTGNKSV